MSKNSLYMIVAIAIAATALTFAVSGQDPGHICLPSNSPGDVSTDQTNPATENQTSIQATTHGAPWWYYEEPLPASCLAQNQTVSGVGGRFDSAHLGYDFLVWLAAAFVLFLPSALYRWWRGPRMLGDFRGRA